VLKAWRPAAILLICLAPAACGPAPPPATVTAAPDGPVQPEALQVELSALPPGNAASGKSLFSSAGCVACHSLEAGVRIVGPSLSGVATRAATRKAGYSAQLYLYESITLPNAYVVDGFPNGLMPQDFKTRLKSQDLSDLIAFLMTEQ
jgi:mono/diheme cytochrome c family protein